jgi:hypothetical protein
MKNRDKDIQAFLDNREARIALAWMAIERREDVRERMKPVGPPRLRESPLFIFLSLTCVALLLLLAFY